uniref:Uncharacterized protein n=1 Tax=Romanomermis culicivorax TaxID=13658 RepID=A0A915ILW0_ROMCU
MFQMPSVTNSTITKKDEAQLGQQAANEGALGTSDGLGQIKQIVQNKLRNLEKRRARLETLKISLDQGKTLTDEQQAAYAQLSSVDAVIESHFEMLKTIGTAQAEVI